MNHIEHLCFMNRLLRLVLDIPCSQNDLSSLLQNSLSQYYFPPLLQNEVSSFVTRKKEVHWLQNNWKFEIEHFVKLIFFLYVLKTFRPKNLIYGLFKKIPTKPDFNNLCVLVVSFDIENTMCFEKNLRITLPDIFQWRLWLWHSHKLTFLLGRNKGRRWHYFHAKCDKR